MMFFFIQQRQKSVRIFFQEKSIQILLQNMGKCFMITDNIKEETPTPFTGTSQIESLSIQLPYFHAMDLLTQHMMENMK